MMTRLPVGFSSALLLHLYSCFPIHPLLLPPFGRYRENHNGELTQDEIHQTAKSLCQPRDSGSDCIKCCAEDTENGIDEGLKDREDGGED